MIRFRTLGSIDLRRDDGEPVDAVLRQSKRLALLAFLAATPAGRQRRRDLLLATFWPELDESRARSALSGALSFLRRHLGADAITTRGEEEVGCNPERVWSDVAEIRRAADENREDDALALYDGDLLPGLNVPGASGFDEWLDAERIRLRELTTTAAASLADRALAHGRLSDAVRYARRAVSLAPLDERLVRRLIEVLDVAGDRGGAVRCYEEFASRILAQLDAEPSAETKALAARLRERSAPATRPRAEPTTTAIAEPAPSSGGRIEIGWWPIRTTASASPIPRSSVTSACCGRVARTYRL